MRIWTLPTVFWQSLALCLVIRVSLPLVTMAVVSQIAWRCTEVCWSVYSLPLPPQMYLDSAGHARRVICNRQSTQRKACSKQSGDVSNKNQRSLIFVAVVAESNSRANPLTAHIPWTIIAHDYKFIKLISIVHPSKVCMQICQELSWVKLLKFAADFALSLAASLACLRCHVRPKAHGLQNFESINKASVTHVSKCSVDCRIKNKSFD